MIFATRWKHGMHPYTGLAGMSLDAARLYASDILHWCAASRDYPYSRHPEPAPPRELIFVFEEIRTRVLREFNRSNPGHEINTN